MPSRVKSFNPYDVLRVERSASDEEVREAFSRRLAEDPASSVRIQHAYRILKNPQLRKRLNQELDALVWDTAADSEPAAPTAPPRPAGFLRSLLSGPRAKLLVLGALTVVLAGSVYFNFLREPGRPCPECHRPTVHASGQPDGGSLLRCTRDDCGFQFVYRQGMEEDDEGRQS